MSEEKELPPQEVGVPYQPTKSSWPRTALGVFFGLPKRVQLAALTLLAALVAHFTGADAGLIEGALSGLLGGEEPAAVMAPAEPAQLPERKCGPAPLDPELEAERADLEQLEGGQ